MRPKAEGSRGAGSGRHRGFTIAEVLIAILITGIVAGVVYSSYIGGIRIILSAQRDMDRTSMGRIVLDRLATDFSGAFLRAGKEWLVFVGVDTGGGEAGGSDTVTFISANHRRSERDAHESTLSEVSWSLDPGAKGELFITRREDPTLDEDPFSGGETRVVGEGISGLDFEYFDGESWTSSWDSREEDLLPLAVRATLVLRTEEEGGGEKGEEKIRSTTFATESAVPAGGDWEEKEEEAATPTPVPRGRTTGQRTTTTGRTP